MESISFTGYRPEKFSFSLTPNDKEFLEFYNDLYDAVEKECKNPCTFYSGGAEGFDIIAAEIVLTLKQKYKDIKLIMALPFKKQSSAYKPSYLKRYNALLSSADKVIYLEQEYNSTCYFKRNRFLVDSANKIITYYDGKKGGTKYTLDYARKKAKEIINICK